MFRRCRILFLFAGLLSLSACHDPDPMPGLEGAEVIAYNLSGELNLLDPNSSVSFTLNVRRDISLDVPAIIVEESINGEGFVEVERLSSWPVNVTYALSDMAARPVGFAYEDLRKGSEVTFRLLPQGVEGAIPSFLTFQIGCVSDLAGTYKGETIGRAGPGGGGAYDTIRYEVTVESLGNGRYELSELTGGMYPTIWGGKPQAGQLIDSCLQIIIPVQTDQWDDQVTGTGEVLEDGRIYYSWENTYGDSGQTWLKK